MNLGFEDSGSHASRVLARLESWRWLVGQAWGFHASLYLQVHTILFLSGSRFLG